MKIIEKILKSLLNEAEYNRDIQEGPACILWPDRDCQWEPVIPRLQKELPQLFILGNYDSEKHSGPAIWLRCVMAGKISECKIPDGHIPVFYLPGVSRQELRAVENCPGSLNPLIELQYRGVIWSQVNGKDWTVMAFLKSKEGGLGLEVGQDNDTKNAMLLSLYRLMDEDIEPLEGKKLDKDYFNKLLTGGDPDRELLMWLDSGDKFKTSLDINEWRGFVELCKSIYAYNPENDGPISGAARLAEHKGSWKSVWNRFCEAPARYPGIPLLIRKTPLPLPDDLFEDESGWPQWNDDEEKSLRIELINTENMTPYKAREHIKELEIKNKMRRDTVWAELGEAPLACALEHIAILAEITTNSITSGTIQDIEYAYKTAGWKGDYSLIKALAFGRKQEDLKAIQTALRSVYLEWAENSARYLQKLADRDGYPGGNITVQENIDSRNGECTFFVDGLRFDLGKRLSDLCSRKNLSVEETARWVPLPSITSTGKPALLPLRKNILGKKANNDFELYFTENDHPYKGQPHMKKILALAEWEFLEKSEMGDAQGKGWCETGNIDQEGHDRGIKMAQYIEDRLEEILNKVELLLTSGWKTVRIVTDHGWLLMPGGLPKFELPSFLTENKSGRYAMLKEGAECEEKLYPWYWNPEIEIALADGISCYKSGEEYVHGGLSFQEALVLELNVSREGHYTEENIKITGITWKGLRCTVTVDGKFSSLSLDIRTEPGNSSSSIVDTVKDFKDKPSASVVVEDEDREGTKATVVLFNQNNEILAQADTIIGGN